MVLPRLRFGVYWRTTLVGYLICRDLQETMKERLNKSEIKRGDRSKENPATTRQVIDVQR